MSRKSKYLLVLSMLFSLALFFLSGCEKDIDESLAEQSGPQLSGKGDVKSADTLQINALCYKLGIIPNPECDLCAYFGWYGDDVKDYNLVRAKVCKKMDPDISKDPITLPAVSGLKPVDEIAIKLGLDAVGPNADICAYYGWYGDGPCDNFLKDLDICKKWDPDCGEDPNKTTVETKVCTPSVPKTNSGKICDPEKPDCAEGEVCKAFEGKKQGMCLGICCPTPGKTTLCPTADSKTQAAYCSPFPVDDPTKKPDTNYYCMYEYSYGTSKGVVQKECPNKDNYDLITPDLTNKPDLKLCIPKE